ncbi:MAG: alpha-ribazole phosphatase family protein [Gammaproteobacteria bacterium]|nr:alpha-ribazole phosphatase family protein [Gammaproteobacteria bacterium]
MLINLLRHGEVEGENCFRGHSDEPLSKAGWLQMTNAVACCQPDLIISSPLKRCAVFAAEWSAQQQIKLIEMADFKEINFGDWDGLSAEQIQLTSAAELNQFWSNPTEYTPPNAETLKDFQRRVVTGWQQLINRFKDQNILLVTHGGVIRIIIAHILSIPVDKILSIESALASMTQIRISFDDNNQSYASLVYHANINQPGDT